MSNLPATAKSTDIQQKDAADGFTKLINELAARSAAQLAKHIKPEYLARVVLTEARKNPKLRECDAASIGVCIATAGQLGLVPSGALGEAYLIPRKNKSGGMECTLIVGYKGLARLARNTGEITKMSAHCVYRGDTFSLSYGLDENLVHVPDMDAEHTPDNMIGAYAVAHTTTGAPVFAFLTMNQINDRRKRGGSGMGHKTPWDTDFAAMARKSAIRALLTSGTVPMATEVADVLERERELEEAIDGGEIEIKPAPKRTAPAALGIEQKQTADPVIERAADPQPVEGEIIDAPAFDDEP